MKKRYQRVRAVTLLVLMFGIMSLLATAPTIAANKTYGPDVIVHNIVSVYDGDTFRANIDNWPDIIGKNMSIRVKGVDTPELRGAECASEKALGYKAKAFTKNMLMNGKRIELRGLGRGKYFRLIADVWVDDVSLTAALLKNGLAYAYDGGTKQSWCTAEELLEK